MKTLANILFGWLEAMFECMRNNNSKKQRVTAMAGGGNDDGSGTVTPDATSGPHG